MYDLSRLLFIVIFLINAHVISSQPLFSSDQVLDNNAAIIFHNNNDSPETKECQFQNEPMVIQNGKDLLFQYWIESDRSILNEPVLPVSPSLHEFRDQINRLMNPDPVALLRNQLSQVSGPDSVNVNLVLKDEAGSIRKMNCLEALLLAVQTDRSVAQGHSMFSNPTEFLSYILLKDDKLKIYYYTVDQPGIGGLSIFSEPLNRDVADGWIVQKNIHNHNFFPESEIVLGGVVPSAADIQYLRNIDSHYGLNSAVITNGFHSIDMSQKDLKKFSTWEPEE